MRDRRRSRDWPRCRRERRSSRRGRVPRHRQSSPGSRRPTRDLGRPTNRCIPRRWRGKERRLARLSDRTWRPPTRGQLTGPGSTRRQARGGHASLHRASFRRRALRRDFPMVTHCVRLGCEGAQTIVGKRAAYTPGGARPAAKARRRTCGAYATRQRRPAEGVSTGAPTRAPSSPNALRQSARVNFLSP